MSIRNIKISPKAFQEIKILVEQGHIKKAAFSNKTLLEFLRSANNISLSKNKPVMLILESLEGLLSSLRYFGYKINSTEDLHKYCTPSELRSRDEIAQLHYDTKEEESKSFAGLRFSSFEPIEIYINNKKEILNTPFDGSATFIHYATKVSFEEDVIVVGVENPQVVWYINRYKYLFKDYSKLVFLSLSEHATNYQYEWLEGLENEYIHFGDYDIAGLNIYLNTIIPRLLVCKKHSFFIPKDIEELMKEHGSAKLFGKQSNMKIEDTDYENINDLIDLIKNKTHKAFEQESLGIL